MSEKNDGAKLKDLGIDSHGVEIVQPSPEEWMILRDIKLRSLDIEPIAFDDPEPTRKKWEARTEQEWRNILAGKMSDGSEGETITLFARQNAKVLGMVSAIIPKDPSLWTIIQHVYIEPEHRGKHVGRKLVNGVLSILEEKKDVGTIGLHVIITQIPAIKLYESLGFEIVHESVQREKRGDQYYNQHLMRYSSQESS